jgi:hypothetical protein
MNVHKKRLSAWLTTGAVALGALAISSGGAGAACSYTVFNPWRSGNTVQAASSRGTTCSGTIDLTTKLRKQRNNLPDIDLVSDTGSGANPYVQVGKVHLDAGTFRSTYSSSTGASGQSAWTSVAKVP